MEYLGGINSHDDDKHDVLTNKSSNFLFYWYNDLLTSKNIQPIKIKYIKISEDLVGLFEIQE